MTLEESKNLFSRLAGPVASTDSAVEKSKFKAHSVALHMNVMEMKRLYYETIDKLIKSGLWRSVKTESGSDVEASEIPRKIEASKDAMVMLNDIQGSLVSVKDSVRELYEFARSVVAITVPVPPGVTPAAVPSTSTLSIPAPLDQDVDMGALTPKAKSIPLEPEGKSRLKKFYDRIKEIEDQISEMEGNLNQRQEEIGDEIQSALESHFNDLKSVINENAQKQELLLAKTKELAATNAASMAALNEEMQVTGGDISELAHEVAEVIQNAETVTQRNDALSQEVLWLRSENARLQKANDELERRQMEELTQMRAETDETKALLQEYMSRPPPPTAPPVQVLVPAVLPLIQEGLRTLFESLHSEIQTLLQAKTTVLHENLASRVQMLHNMMTAFAQWSDSVRDGVDPGYLLRRPPQSAAHRGGQGSQTR